jgi:glutamate synthase domain-containing protein 2/CDGSH-type Zn-finger protein
MADPVIAAREPVKVTLGAGSTYYWCACGRSASQPYCDGSHRGTGIEPLRFEAAESGDAWLCQCKRTGSPPYCDGTHGSLGQDSSAEAGGAESTEARSPAGGDEAAERPAGDEAGSGSREADRARPMPQPTPEEPTLAAIHRLAEEGLEGAHGELVAMGVPRSELPSWDDLQILTAQLARRPLADDAPVDTGLVIGPRAARPLALDIPLLVSDMSFGSLSPEAKIALARGAEAAGTGICSGEGGMLPEEQAANGRYLFELGSARFGWDEALLERVQGFHFKAGQAAKTGVGGHLPAAKNRGRIAEVRGLEPGTDAVSPPFHEGLESPADFRRFADRVREVSGGIPVGMKLSAGHIEADLDFALAAGVDYVILDGRGGGTGAAPAILRDHIAVPTLAAVARARRHLDRAGHGDVTLIVTGGLRTAPDFAKALALGADGVALANAAIQAVGCVAARICHTNNCPSGVATQREDLRGRIDVDHSAARVARYLEASTALMQVLARACGHARLADFTASDLTSWRREAAELAGVPWAGAGTPG